MSKDFPIVALGEVLTLDQRYIEAPEAVLYPKLSVKLYGKGVVLDTPADGATLKMKKHQLAQSGQVILSEIWGKKGAIGLVPSEGEGALCTSHFFLFDINREKLEPKFLQAIFTANYLEEQLGADARGTTGYAAVRPKNLLAAKIPLPPLEEQRRIVARIEELAAKIEEARSLRRESEESIRAFQLSAYSELIKDAAYLPMSEVAPLVRRPVPVNIAETYRELGIRSFGKGTFHKPAINGVELGSKRIFSIEPNDLLFNIVFAWEGAVAVAQPHDAGRVGSHRFLTCVTKEGVTTPTFLRFHFLTRQGLEQMGDASPGGVDRNRTLGTQALANIHVPIPAIEKQLWFDSILSKFDSIKRLQAETTAELDALLPSVLDRAFRGEL